MVGFSIVDREIEIRMDKGFSSILLVIFNICGKCWRDVVHIFWKKHSSQTVNTMDKCLHLDNRQRFLGCLICCYYLVCLCVFVWQLSKSANSVVNATIFLHMIHRMQMISFEQVWEVTISTAVIQVEKEINKREKKKNGDKKKRRKRRRKKKDPVNIFSDFGKQSCLRMTGSGTLHMTDTSLSEKNTIPVSARW